MRSTAVQRPSANGLFQPFTLNSLALANRIVMAPMTRGFSPGGIPGPDVAAYYRRRAEGGGGRLLGPTGLMLDGTEAGSPMTIDEIESVISAAR